MIRMKSYTEVFGVFLVVVVLVLELGLADQSPRTIVTPEFFNSLLSQDDKCRGKGFYSYDAFISAAESNVGQGFGTTGTIGDRKREMAAFLAHVMHETGRFCYIKERIPRGDYCDWSYRQFPCAAGKKYYGRGPLQLSWNYNYGQAGKAIGFKGLTEPEIVGRDASISFKTAVWFWMSSNGNNNCHKLITSDRSFGSTIRTINSGECDGRSPQKVQRRVNFYLRFCRHFGVKPGQNIYC